MRGALAIVLTFMFPAGLTFGQSAQPVQDQPKVILVFPFEMPMGSTAFWIGKAAQEDLMTDLTQATLAQIKSPAEPLPARDERDALKVAREYHADIVIFGQAQVIDLTARLTGQVLDVTTGRALGALKVTGPLHDLFEIEDLLARETFAVLPKSMMKPEVLRYLQQPPVPTQPPPIAQPVQPPAVNNGGPVMANVPDVTDDSSLVPLDSYAQPFVESFYPGSIIIISGGSSKSGREFHQREGRGAGRWDGHLDHARGGTSDAGGQTSRGTCDPVPVRFSWGGPAAASAVNAGAGAAFSGGVHYTGPAQSTFSRGFSVFNRPSTGGFQNQPRGGTASR